MGQGAYSQDINNHGDYIYTGTNRPLSSVLANIRIRRGLETAISYDNKTILDIGSGDGNFTHEFIQRGAKFVLGIDPVEEAVARSTKTYSHVPNMQFECYDITSMPMPDVKFDIAVLRGVLHHIPSMSKGVQSACKLAKEVILVDPNGYNPVLKIIEKVSPYHVAHGERSYFPCNIRREFNKNGATILREEYVNLVPFFCPDSIARLLYKLAPIVEAIPLVRQIACGQYILHIRVEG